MLPLVISNIRKSLSLLPWHSIPNWNTTAAKARCWPTMWDWHKDQSQVHYMTKTSMTCPLLLLTSLCHGLRFRWELLQKLKPCYLIFLNSSKRNTCSDNTINRIKPADIQTPGFEPAVAVSTLGNKNTYRWVEERDVLGWGGVQFLAGEVSMDHSLPSATVAT